MFLWRLQHLISPKMTFLTKLEWGPSKNNLNLDASDGRRRIQSDHTNFFKWTEWIIAMNTGVTKEVFNIYKCLVKKFLW